MKSIMLVFGTRPEAIKMAPLVLELKKYPENFKVIVCVTGQHREMLDQVIDFFEIIPDYDLNIMKNGQDLYDVTSNVLLGMRNILNDIKPDIILVHGDTSTSTAAALSAFYKQIPVGHIEAGLRTNDIYNPWPEEVNRQVTSRISKFHFAPTRLAKKNLLKENIDEKNIIITGNTVIDALNFVINKIKLNPELNINLKDSLITAGYDTNRLDEGRKLVLITGHRRENFGNGFINILKAIKDLAIKYKNVDFVYPMHPNPNVRNSIMQVFGKEDNKNSNLFFIEPLDYLSFIFIMEKSYLILTDSGGIQEEAPSLGKPVLVMRETTERPEAIDAGTVKLVGTNYLRILEAVSRLIDDDFEYEKISSSINPYGDGLACYRIVAFLKGLYTTHNT